MKTLKVRRALILILATCLTPASATAHAEVDGSPV
jgi:methionine-rich copper-binding protein CopC